MMTPQEEQAWAALRAVRERDAEKIDAAGFNAALRKVALERVKDGLCVARLERDKKEVSAKRQRELRAAITALCYRAERSTEAQEIYGPYCKTCGAHTTPS